MVYLAREDDSPADRDGVVEWHLRVDRQEYEIGKVSLFANMVCHSEEAAAHLVLCNSATTELSCLCSVIFSSVSLFKQLQQSIGRLLKENLMGNQGDNEHDVLSEHPCLTALLG
ncbi:hypothetical protein AHF37_11567 [Paragonimus kellicotti]|nr:hypothetical protein AHF37_11567 [Paragonimus kellicotti]